MTLVFTRSRPRIHTHRHTFAKALVDPSMMLQFVQMWGQVTDMLRTRMDGRAMRDAIASNDLVAAEALGGWDELGTRLTPLLSQAQEAGAMMPDNLRIVGAFNRTDPRAWAFAERQSAALVRQVTDETRDMIRGTISDAFAEGITPRDTAKRLQSFIGLTGRQQTAVINAQAREYMRLRDAGASVADADRLSQEHGARVQARAIKTRAQTIARTEIKRAEMAGRYMSWAQAIEEGTVSDQSRKQWLADGSNPCEICAPYDDEVVMWDDAFSNGEEMPPAHPNCMCVAVLMPPDTELSAAPADAPDATINDIEPPDVTPDMSMDAETAAREAFKADAMRLRDEIDIPNTNETMRAIGEDGGWTDQPSEAMQDAEAKVRELGAHIDTEVNRRLANATEGLEPLDVVRMKAREADAEYGRLVLERDDMRYRLRDEYVREVGGADAEWFRWYVQARQEGQFPNGLDDVWSLLRDRSPDLGEIEGRIADAAAYADELSELVKTYPNYNTVLNEVLADVRPMGPPDGGVQWLEGTLRKPGTAYADLTPDLMTPNNVTMSDQALANYPTSWIESSNDRGPMLVGDVRPDKARGFQRTEFHGIDKGSGLIHIPPADEFSERLYVHEWGHRMEATVPDVRRMEWAFYKRRAGDEELQSLADIFPGSGYESDELAILDDVANPYILKSYGSSPTSYYEILSMGREGILQDTYDILGRDADFRHFIVGLLGGVG